MCTYTYLFQTRNEIDVYAVDMLHLFESSNLGRCSGGNTAASPCFFHTDRLLSEKFH